eukprot:GHVP01013776.1.p2 GENE.GHVP01013776.1~~GHVP01013776.1.p2  ORF type:complete len:115 (-),score=17.97 GHVP01013776.1:869-1213(-)
MAMLNFRFSNDKNLQLDEARKQLNALYPEHSDTELFPLSQKVSCAIGANDYQQARAMMINPNRPYYFQTKEYKDYGNNKNNNWKKKTNYNQERTNSPPKSKFNQKKDFGKGATE